MAHVGSIPAPGLVMPPNQKELSNVSSARVIYGSMGSFLDPPGSAQRIYEVIEGPANNPRSMMSLEGALDAGWIPEQTKTHVRNLLDSAKVECTEGWLADVYRHFRHCYSPDGINRNASDCIIDRENTRPADHHLAVLFVRKWFPDHSPRTDLF